MKVKFLENCSTNGGEYPKKDSIYEVKVDKDYPELYIKLFDVIDKLHTSDVPWVITIQDFRFFLKEKKMIIIQEE